MRHLLFWTLCALWFLPSGCSLHQPCRIPWQGWNRTLPIILADADRVIIADEHLDQEPNDYDLIETNVQAIQSLVHNMKVDPNEQDMGTACSSKFLY
jgi:hypothetical protein